jgi:hypothetical protein
MPTHWPQLPLKDVALGEVEEQLDSGDGLASGTRAFETQLAK